MADENTRYTAEINFVIIGQHDGRRDARFSAEYQDLEYDKVVSIETLLLEAMQKLNQMGIDVAEEIAGKSNKSAGVTNRKA